MRRTAILIFLGLATTALAAPQQSAPLSDASVMAASCPAGDTPAKLDDLPLHAEAVPPEAVDVSGGRNGHLIYLGGLKLSADDPRFGDIIGLQLDPKFGLIAATGAGNWIQFHAADADFVGFKSATIAPMRGLAGPPTVLTRIGQSFIAASHDGRNLDRYETTACGLSAHAVAVGGISAPEHLVAMAPVTYATALMAGMDPTGARRDLVAPHIQPGLKLGDPEIPSLLGFELVDVAGPEVVAPFNMVALWRRAGGGTRTRVQVFNLPKWSNTPAPNMVQSDILADLPLPLRAVAGAYDAQSRTVRLWMVSQAGPKEPTYLLAFAMTAING
jgi:hypothetical protein